MTAADAEPDRLARDITSRTATATILAQTIGRAVSLLAVIGSTAIVARHLDLDGYADWATVLSIVALAGVLLDPGISPVVVRRLAQDPASAPTAASLVRVRLALGATTLAIVVAATVLLRGADALALAIVLGAQVVPRALVLNATPWLQLDHRLHRQTAWEAGAAGLGLLCLAAAAAAGASAPLLALAGFTGPALLLTIAIARELRVTPSRRLDIPGPQPERVRSVLREVAPLALALLLVATYTRSFVVFLNVDEDSAVVAQFLFAFQFIEQVIVAAAIVAGAALPLLAIRHRTTPLLRDPLSHDLLVAIAALGALISASIVLVASPLTRVIGGADLAPAGHYLTLLAPMGAFVVPAFVLGYLYIAAGRGRDYLAFNFFALLVNLAANAIFTLQYGAQATARISWATEAVVVAIALAAVARHSATGSRAALHIAVTAVIAIVGAELAAAGVLPPAVAAAGIAAGVTLSAHRQLGWLAGTLLGSHTLAADARRLLGRLSMKRIPAPLAALLAVAFILGTTWATLTPAFQAPDENSHTAYAQILAERFKLPGIEGRPGQSTEQRAAASALNSDQVAGVLLTRPEWSRAAEQRWAELDATLGPAARKDGGGPNPASPNPPLSYLADAAAYRVAGGDLFTRQWAMRMTSVLAFLLAVLAAWLLAGEVFARDRMLQLAAAGTIALQPMIGFLAGAVMPDPLVIALSTLALWFGARILKRGLTTHDALALGLVVGAACVTKSASFVLLPAALLAVGVGAVRARRSGAARVAVPVLAAGAGLVATLGAWIVIARVIGRAAASQVGGTATGASALDIRELGSYVWQFYLPRLSFQTPFPRTSEAIPVFEYWVKGLWANFGWLEVHFGDPVYYVIAGAMVLVAGLAISTAIRMRRSIDWALAAFFLLALLTAVAGLHWTEYRQFSGGATSFIQGRYLLPLAGIGGLAVALALRQFTPRTRALLTGVWLSLIFTLTLFSLALSWDRFYA